jgi:hypothetical protein
MAQKARATYCGTAEILLDEHGLIEKVLLIQ